MISIVVPLYNKLNSIVKCIESVLEQSFKDWELIIIDDGSTDDSASIVQTYIHDDRIKYIYKSNGGVSSARNLGIFKSKGEWIVFLDADDYFLPDALEILYGAVMKYKTLISTANFKVKKGENEYVFCKGKYETIISNNYRSWFLKTIFPRTGAALFHSSILKEHLFDERLSRYEDAKSLFEIFREYKIAYSPKPIMVYSLDNIGLSQPSSDVQKDFIFGMNFQNKSFWEKIVLADLLLQGYKLYPEYIDILDTRYRSFLYMIPITKLLIQVRRVYNRLLRVIL